MAARSRGGGRGPPLPCLHGDDDGRRWSDHLQQRGICQTKMVRNYQLSNAQREQYDYEPVPFSNTGNCEFLSSRKKKQFLCLHLRGPFCASKVKWYQRINILAKAEVIFSTVKNKEIGTGKYTHSMGTAYLAFSRNNKAVKPSMAEHQAWFKVYVNKQ